MELREIKISEILSNPAQPEVRTTPQAIRGLKESIEKNGLLVPITVKPLAGGKYEQIDGHRRVTCLNALGQKTVTAIIYNGELNHLNSVQAFRIANEHSRKISALEYLDIYFNNGEVPSNIMKTIIFIIDKLGKPALRKLRRERISPYNVQRIHPLFKKLEFDGIEFCAFWDWAVKHRMIRLLNVYEKLNNSATRNAKLLECIKGDKPFILE